MGQLPEKKLYHIPDFNIFFQKLYHCLLVSLTKKDFQKINLIHYAEDNLSI